MELWITALLVTAVNAALLLYTVRVVGRARSSRSWPTVQATVIDSRVVGSKTFKPRIEYAYVIDGQRYTSRRISVGMAMSVSGNWAAEMVAACPTGSTMLVAVDPHDPAYAVMKTGLQGVHWLTIAVVGGLLLAGCASLVVIALLPA